MNSCVKQFTMASFLYNFPFRFCIIKFYYKNVNTYRLRRDVNISNSIVYN